MGSAETTDPPEDPGPTESRARLLSVRVALFVWLPIAAIGAIHYGTPGQLEWVHDIARRSYYLPIIVAAFLAGLRGGLSASVVVSLSYLPHAFVHLGHVAHADPADGVHKALEILLYNVVGGVSGYLADTERRGRTRLRRALDEQRQLQRQLVRAGRLGALGELIAGVAHELKNPIHSLKGTAEVVTPVVENGADESQRRMWTLHVSELERLERIAGRFLSFASPRPIEQSAIDLRDIARNLVELVEADARGRGVEVRARLPGEPVRVSGDGDLLTQVAMNIALNAVRAIERGSADGVGAAGTVRLSVRSDAEFEGRTMHALVLENDGPPIPEAEMEHLFDPFHGSDEAGSGLGLSISQRIIDQHAGAIDVANAGLGVRFTVYLPRYEG